MFNEHAPPGYWCPFCYLLGGGETEANVQHDIVRRDRLHLTSLVAPQSWTRTRCPKRAL
jgi:hypothetical protein